MKKKQTNNYHLSFILITISVIVYISFFINVHRNETDNNKVETPTESSTRETPIQHRSDEQIREPLSIFYRLTSDERYHYEFRFEFNPNTRNGEHRLMIVLNGAGRSCSDMWNFSVGLRILEAMYRYGYSVLVVCSQRKTFDVDMPIGKNNDAKYIYLALQRWIKEEYYTRFEHYPLLYIHATSRGAKFAGILCRILPIQAQTLYIYAGHREAMLAPSAYDPDLQTRLSLDPTFANWFYFDFCYNKTAETSDDRQLCPFQNEQNYYNPLAPSFFTFLEKIPINTNRSTDILSKKSIKIDTARRHTFN